MPCRAKNTFDYSFRLEMASAGLEAPKVIIPGKFHRFPGAEKCSSNRAGWCLLFDDLLGGCFGDWSTGLFRTWFSQQGRPRSGRAQAAVLHQIKAARLRAELQRREKHEAAAARAHRIWDEASAPPEHHGYLLKKGIEPHNARFYKGCLVLPVKSFESVITSLQFITSDGDKRLLSGGCKRGCFIPVSGDERHAQRILICEGWATGCTLATEEPAALVLAAIDAGNLKSVALSARYRWPSGEIVVAGDDDRLTPGNPGATNAKAAAIAADALLALPQWPPDAPARLSDFNDLAQWLSGGRI